MKTESAMLLAAAHSQRQKAQTLCHAECRHYHSAWPFLRAAALVGGIDADRAALSKLIEPLLKKPDGRVLIAGCADEVQLALLIDLAGSTRFHCTIVDRCATPMQACQTLATQSKHIVRTHVSDLLDFEPPHKFDLILCHSLLPFLNAQERERLWQKFSIWLAPQGSLVLAVKIDPAQDGQKTAADASVWIDDKTEIAQTAMVKLPIISIEDRAELNLAVRGFYQFMAARPTPYRSIEEVSAECTAANLQVQETCLAGVGHGFPGAHARVSLTSILLHAKPLVTLDILSP